MCMAVLMSVLVLLNCLICYDIVCCLVWFNIAFYLPHITCPEYVMHLPKGKGLPTV